MKEEKAFDTHGSSGSKLKYRDWDILETLPEGWVIDKYAGSPAPNTVFITNGKSVLNGQKRALLKVQAKQDINISKNEIPKVNHFVEDNMTIKEEIEKLQKRREMAAYQRKITTQLLTAIEYDDEIGAIDRRLEQLQYKLKAEERSSLNAL